MLTIFSKPHKQGGFCDGLNRRDFLTIGGSIETLTKELTVMPKGVPASSSVVMTAMPVGKRPKARRSSGLAPAAAGAAGVWAMMHLAWMVALRVGGDAQSSRRSPSS